MTKHVVAAVRDLPPGGRKLTTVNGRDIVVFNLDGQFYGLLNRCPHQGGSLCNGVLSGVVSSVQPGHYDYTRRGELIRCPWHGWQFDIKTGQSWCEPGRIKTVAYTVGTATGQELVEGPYVAETVPVSVEQEYVVIEG